MEGCGEEIIVWKRVKHHHLSPCEDTVLLNVKSAPVEFVGNDYSIFFPPTCSLDHIPINTHQRISKGKDTECRTHTRHSSTNPYWALINVCDMNVAQAFSCYCESGCWGVATSRWGPGRWASSSRGCWVQRSRTGRWVWRRASRGGAGSQPSTWLSSLSRRGRTAQIREWELQRPRTQQARSPARGARRDPRSCTGDILGGRWSRRLLLGPPLPRISGPSRGVRGRGRKWGRPRADAPQGWNNTSTFNYLRTPNQSIFERKGQTFAGFSELNVKMCCFSLSHMIVTEEFWDCWLDKSSNIQTSHIFLIKWLINLSWK